MRTEFCSEHQGKRPSFGRRSRGWMIILEYILEKQCAGVECNQLLKMGSKYSFCENSDELPIRRKLGLKFQLLSTVKGRYRTLTIGSQSDSQYIISKSVSQSIYH
jgi:hypothetical protein